MRPANDLVRRFAADLEWLKSSTQAVEFGEHAGIVSGLADSSATQ
jgi:hypothetical protein